MNILGHTVTMAESSRFFKDRNSLITDAANAAERRKRLEWLAEGCLQFCLNPDNRPPDMEFGTCGGLQSEKDLFTDFIAWKRQQKRCGG